MVRRSVFFVVAIVLTLPALAAADGGKLDPALRARAEAPRGTSRVIITTVSGGRTDAAIRAAGGLAGRFLHAIGGQAALVPDSRLLTLAARPEVRRMRLDRPVAGTMERTGAAVGAAWVTENLGYDGAGIGVAIIDSGVANWHDDLGSQRVARFVDFVDDMPVPHDGYGHGTHVAGIIAGSGYDSAGARRGIAPGATLVVLRVLDEAGEGHISNVIAAIDYAISRRTEFNIRVINLSVASGVYESFTTDPLTLAARRAVEAGIVVVTAAGNHGRSAQGTVQHGGITSPGNAPWVVTVGAADHRMTAPRGDDVVAAFSSRGPTLIDQAMKPDLVAPGVAIESLADAGSTIFALHPDARLWGSVDTATPPYLSLTGTSMAAPVVAGTIALMLQANAALTPNLVKAVLHYTAETKRRFPLAAQGAGFLNARGAVQLASALRGETGITPDLTRWSRHILWGHQRVRGGRITADANAWRSDVVWGAAETGDGDPIVWGTLADDTVWGTAAREDAPLSEMELEQLWTARSPAALPELTEAAGWRQAHAPTGGADAAWLPEERRLPRRLSAGSPPFEYPGTTRGYLRQ